MNFYKKLVFGLIAILGISANSSFAQPVEGCGDLRNAYGPFDYRTRKDKLGVVNAFHFTPDVEQLKRGKSGSVEGDLAYTLRAFPNHHRALQSFDRWERKKLRNEPFYRPRDGVYTADCYYKRAIVFAPTDSVVRLLYGMYFAKRDKNTEAEKYYLSAIELDDGMMDAYYNLGLVYLEEKDYEQAKENAEMAYRLGHPLPGLRNKLVQAGAW